LGAMIFHSNGIHILLNAWNNTGIGIGSGFIV
jgi:hypothetical protein